MEVDTDEQTEVFRVPKHGDVNALELLNDFIGVISESMQRSNLILP